MSPRRAELAVRITITSLLRHKAGGPASLTPLPSACLHSPVEATLITLGNVSCWFIFNHCFVFVWENIYISIYINI